MRIYIAARYDRRFEMLGVAAGLIRAGHEGGRGGESDLVAALGDVGDLAQADCMVNRRAGGVRRTPHRRRYFPRRPLSHDRGPVAPAALGF